MQISGRYGYQDIETWQNSFNWIFYSWVSVFQLSSVTMFSTRCFNCVLSNICNVESFIFFHSHFSATLYYIIKGRDKHKYGTPFKNHIIRTLLNGMSTHLNDEVWSASIFSHFFFNVLQAFVFWPLSWILSISMLFVSDNDAKRLPYTLPILDSKRRCKYTENWYYRNRALDLAFLKVLFTFVRVWDIFLGNDNEIIMRRKLKTPLTLFLSRRWEWKRRLWDVMQKCVTRKIDSQKCICLIKGAQ